MSLPTFTISPIPPGTPPPPALNANTYAGVLPVLASSNLVSLQNANVDNLVDRCFPSLPESDADGDGEILGESSVADKISAPLFPIGLSMTSSPVEVDSTAKGTVSEGAEGGGIFSTSLSSTQRAYNSHITSNNFVLLVLTM
jgi:hypothetical protein